MAVPKRRLSKSKIRSRKRSHAHRRPMATTSACPQCGEPRQPHRVCPSCGSYAGRQVRTITADE